MWLEKIICIKRCFMYMNDDKNDGKAFEKLNFEAESECWFEKLLRLAV